MVVLEGFGEKFVLDASGHVIKEIVDPYGHPTPNRPTMSTGASSRPPIPTITRLRLPTIRGAIGSSGSIRRWHSEDDRLERARGSKVSETDENLNVTQFRYDAMNRLIEQRRVMPGGTDLVSTFAYNQRVGAKTWASDPNGHATSTVYDALQRPVSITDALGHATMFGYRENSGGSAFDSSGFKATLMQDANGYTKTITYDAL